MVSRTGADVDHVQLHDRLVALTDPIFEHLLLVARVNRSLFSPRTAPLATRAQEVAELAQFDAELCRRLMGLLDDQAPWTRDPPPLSSRREPPGHGGDIEASMPAAAGAPDAADRRPAPTGVALEELLDRLARVKRAVDEQVKARPRPFAQLATRIGCRPEDLPDHLVDLRGSAVAEHVLAVYDRQPATKEGDDDRGALESVLFTVLPYVSDWRAVVADCCARGEGQADVVVLPYHSHTIAEAVMAGWVGRRCFFEHKEGREPYGVGAVELPADSRTALFTSEQHLLEGVVKQLMYQLGVPGENLQQQRANVRAALKVRGRPSSPQRLRYYFLFRDAAWSKDRGPQDPESKDPESKDPESMWRLARAALHGEAGLPSLVLMRMQGSGEDEAEAVLGEHVRAMLSSWTPPRS